MSRSPICLCLLLTACAAQQVRPDGSDGEVTVEEATVVHARSGAEAGLPPLPGGLQARSESFRTGYSRALEVLAQSGPAPPPGSDVGAYQQWLQIQFGPWIEARGRDVSHVLEPLEQLPADEAGEHVIAAALIGSIYRRTLEQFFEIPPPPGIEDDSQLGGHYRLGLQQAASRWIEQAEQALSYCAGRAAEQTEPVFAQWVDYCNDGLAALSQRTRELHVLAERMEQEAKAELAAQIGPRPAGPEICWHPQASPGAVSGGEPQAEPSEASAPEGSGGASAKAKRCARQADAERSPRPPRNPRDEAYGVLDEDSGVRVFVRPVGSAPADESPLVTTDAQQRLARCFASHVGEEEAQTLAVQLSLSVDPRGKVAAVELTPEVSDEAQPPSKRLNRCVTSELRKTAFDCPPSGQSIEHRALLCMRRDRGMVETLER